jgi:hypothetical protein
VAATFVTQGAALLWRVDGLIKYFCTLKWYVQTMQRIVNLDPQVERTYPKDCAEPAAHAQASLTIKATSRRKAESPGAQLDANRPETSRLEPAIQSSRFDGYHRVAQMDYPHERRWQAVHTRENPSRPKDSIHFSEKLVLQC